jgi:hypothetical protein
MMGLLILNAARHNATAKKRGEQDSCEALLPNDSVPRSCMVSRRRGCRRPLNQGRVRRHV